jgi:hypothetical protein
MIDTLDKKTKDLPLEQPKRGRGRPKTGAALTPAQKQKAYRERLKGNVTVNTVTAIDERMQLREQLLKAIKRAELAEAERDVMGNELAKARAQISGNRLNKSMERMIQDVHDVADALSGSTWRIQRRNSASGKWVTLKGSYWQEAKAEDALAEMKNKKGYEWRIIEVKSEVED